MSKVDLVFRRVDERTRDLSLELAVRHLRPENVHIIDDVRPFSKCVEQMLRIEHDCDYVVYVDADCLILEDMRAFIDQCGDAYVDTYVSDRFRGRVHCGVHITRADLVRYMGQVEVPPGDLKYFLRPESRVRNLAMKPRRMSKRFRNFDVLHDHFQYYRHVFFKYALRELRSRTPRQRKRLALAMDAWPKQNGAVNDYVVARYAIQYAHDHVPDNSDPSVVNHFIESLHDRAAEEMARLDIEEKGDFGEAELNQWLAERDSRNHFSYAATKPKVFGLGLSRTGTRSLTSALQVLGWDCVHYPIDEDTFNELAYGQYDLTILKSHDGVTDITVAPYYAQLDKAYPGSKFILTIRDKEAWLRSCQNHWFNRGAFKESQTIDDEIHMKVRRLLRAAVYGCYSFVPERFSWVYDQHVKNVLDYFEDRPDDLLVIDICGGDHWQPLADFLGRELPTEPFPHKGSVLSQRVNEMRAAGAL